MNRERLVVDLLKAHELDPEEYMTSAAEDVSGMDAIALAEEQNKQIIAGQQPEIIPEMITPEHIQVHDALIKSGQIDDETRTRLQQHVMEEMRIAKTGGAMAEGEEMSAEMPAVERNPELAKPLMKMPGLTKETVSPGTAAELISKTSSAVTGPAPNKPVVKPR